MLEWQVMTEVQASAISGVDSAHNGYHMRIPAFPTDLNGNTRYLKSYSRGQKLFADQKFIVRKISMPRGI